jgi:preprotein translocase subunit SecG
MSNTLILAVQVIISILLIASILLQQRGVGLGGAFGGEGNVYRTRRGVERSLFYATIILGIAFVVFAVLAVFVGKLG